MRSPRRLSQKLILSLTVVVSLVVVANGLIAVRSADTQLKAAMLLSAAADVVVCQLVNARASVRVSLARSYVSSPRLLAALSPFSPPSPNRKA